MDATIPLVKKKVREFRSNLCGSADRVDRFSRDGWGSGGHLRIAQLSGFQLCC